MKRIDHVLWGLVLIVLGLIFGVNALGFAHIDVFLTVGGLFFIIVPCFIGMFHKEDRTGEFNWSSNRNCFASFLSKHLRLWYGTEINYTVRFGCMGTFFDIQRYDSF